MLKEAEEGVGNFYVASHAGGGGMVVAARLGLTRPSHFCAVEADKRGEKEV